MNFPAQDPVRRRGPLRQEGRRGGRAARALQRREEARRAGRQGL